MQPSPKNKALRTEDVPCDSSGIAWHVFRAQPKRERLAVESIRRLANLDSFSPRISFFKKTRTGKKRFVEALFPGYVFVQCDIAHDLRHVLSLQGVSGVVKLGAKIPALSSFMIEDLRSGLGESDEPIVLKQDTFEEGCEVSIVEGSFKDMKAIVQQYLPAEQRIQVLVEFLGRDLEITLPGDSVLPE